MNADGQRLESARVELGERMLALQPRALELAHG
jgi:hypothetical protein